MSQIPRSLLALFLVAFLSACADNTTPGPSATPEPTATPETTASGSVAGLVAEDAYARAAPAGGVSAVYMALRNGTAVPDTLLSARTDAASRVEIHRTEVGADGLSAMTPVEGGLAVPADDTVRLEPGGLHVMLLDLQRDLGVGDTLDVEVEFAGQGPRVLRVPVRADAR